jgi:RNA polymerase sigma factor (TIGR02999 family)
LDANHNLAGAALEGRIDVVSEERRSVTHLLHDWQAGDAGALELATRAVYDELHRLAQHYMRDERRGHTLQPTALLSEVFLRLCGSAVPPLECRSQFVAIVARRMRQILVDHARQRSAEKRGGDVEEVSLDEELPETLRGASLVGLDDALSELATFDERKAKIVEWVYFGGLQQQEIATLLDIHVNTVARDLRLALVWLKSKIHE